MHAGVGASLEIERKYLIVRPDEAWIASLPGMCCEEITQTYLSGNPEEEVRVRRRGKPGAYAYFRTSKRMLSGICREETETGITREEYDVLLKNADPQRRTIEKTRVSFPYNGKTIEIDLYPFWDDCAILEVELLSESEEILLPQQIRILREVTDDLRYKNAALAAASDLNTLR